MSQKVQKRIGKGKLVSCVTDQLSEKGFKVPHSEAAAVVDATFESIRKLLHEEGRVNIPSFGTFILVNSSPRRSKNPKSGEIINVEAKKRPKFRAAIGLMAEFNPKD
jgi:nucleoid DNA-binding protein